MSRLLSAILNSSITAGSLTPVLCENEYPSLRISFVPLYILGESSGETLPLTVNYRSRSFPCFLFHGPDFLLSGQLVIVGISHVRLVLKRSRDSRHPRLAAPNFFHYLQSRDRNEALFKDYQTRSILSFYVQMMSDRGMARRRNYVRMRSMSISSISNMGPRHTWAMHP